MKLALLIATAACGSCTSGAGADAAVAGAAVRVAELGADLPGKVDVCFMRAGEALLGGPIARAVGAPYLELGQVTRYVDLAAGPADVRVVAAPSTGCGVGLRPDLAVVIPAGRSTVAIGGLISGDVAHPLVALVVPDDPPALALGVRTVNLDAGAPALDVGVTCAASAFSGVAAAYGAVGAYRCAPFTDCVPTARVPAATDDYAHTTGRASVAPGTFHTAYVFGRRIILCEEAEVASPLAPCVE